MAFVGGGAAAAAIAKASQSTGAVVRLEPDEFLKLLRRAERPIIVVGQAYRAFSRKPQYLMNYRGFFFVTTPPEPLELPADAEIITAKMMWVPV